MSFSDLSFCCEWGCKLVTDHKGSAGPLQMTLPVLTSPDIVQLAVTGIYRGEIAEWMSDSGILPAPKRWEALC
ncbi:hypothetical protein WJX82_002094 [Trebouxia sp. C0006]